MRAKTLISEGAKITVPLTFHRDRPKLSGYMYSGKLELEKGGIKYHFNMWYHGGDTMTEDQALDNVSLAAVTYQGKYYESYWHTVMTEDAIWLHPTGWFNNRRLELEVDSIFPGKGRGNYNFNRDVLNDQQREEIKRLGFIRVAQAEVNPDPFQATVTRVLRSMGTYRSPKQVIDDLMSKRPKLP